MKLLTISNALFLKATTASLRETSPISVPQAKINLARARLELAELLVSQKLDMESSDSPAPCADNENVMCPAVSRACEDGKCSNGIMIDQEKLGDSFIFNAAATSVQQHFAESKTESLLCESVVEALVKKGDLGTTEATVTKGAGWNCISGLCYGAALTAADNTQVQMVVQGARAATGKETPEPKGLSVWQNQCQEADSDDKNFRKKDLKLTQAAVTKYFNSEVKPKVNTAFRENKPLLRLQTQNSTTVSADCSLKYEKIANQIAKKLNAKNTYGGTWNVVVGIDYGLALELTKEIFECKENDEKCHVEIKHTFPGGKDGRPKEANTLIWQSFCK